MSQPLVITIAIGAGVGLQPAQQIPLGDMGTVTLLNLSKDAGLTLSTSPDFSNGWPLLPYMVLPQTAVDNLWVQNNNNETVDVLVMQGIIPISLGTTVQSEQFLLGKGVIYGPDGGFSPTLTIPTFDIYPQPNWRHFWIYFTSAWGNSVSPRIDTLVYGLPSNIQYRGYLIPNIGNPVSMSPPPLTGLSYQISPSLVEVDIPPYTEYYSKDYANAFAVRYDINPEIDTTIQVTIQATNTVTNPYDGSNGWLNDGPVNVYWGVDLVPLNMGVFATKPLQITNKVLSGIGNGLFETIDPLVVDTSGTLVPTKVEVVDINGVLAGDARQATLATNDAQLQEVLLELRLTNRLLFELIAGIGIGMTDLIDYVF